MKKPRKYRRPPGPLRGLQADVRSLMYVLDWMRRDFLTSRWTHDPLKVGEYLDRHCGMTRCLKKATFSMERIIKRLKKF